MAAQKLCPDTTLQLSRTFSAPRENVFRAWTTEEALKRWHAPSDDFSTPHVEVDLRVGGRYRIEMKDPQGESHVVTGVYREIVPPEKLVFTFGWEGGEGCGGDKVGDMGETVVTILFEAQGQGNATKVTLTHEFFPTSEIRDKHSMGWTGCLDRLAKAL